MDHTRIKTAALLACCALAGCKADNKASGPGRVAVSTALSGKLPASANRSESSSSGSAANAGPQVCGTFTLQPYSIDSGGAITLAGSPYTFSTNANSAPTNAILGCIDSGTGGNNWGYFVTATDFNDCGLAAGDTSPEPIPGLTPTTASAQVAFNCAAGVDTPVTVDVNVSIPQADSAGYVDISAGVNASTVQTGCKQADISPVDGMLHFGESYIDPTGAIPTGLVGLSQGTPTQFAGTVDDQSGDVDTYYTGLIADPGAPPTILQTFVEQCTGSNQEYADVNHAECLTGAGPSLNGQPPTLLTQALLAGVFLAVPGQGFVSATLQNGQSIAFYTYNNSNGPTYMDASQSPVQLGFNSGMALSYYSGVPAGGSITGLYIDKSTLGGIVASGTDSAARRSTPSSPRPPAPGRTAAGIRSATSPRRSRPRSASSPRPPAASPSRPRLPASSAAATAPREART